MPAIAYEKHKETNRRQMADKSRAGRDIGDLPEVVDQARKDRAERDFRAFCESYFPLTFDLGWSPDHLTVIGQIEQSVLSGGLFATAMPRGSGKSSLSEAACIWAVLYGHRDFVVLIASDEERAKEMLDSIKTDLESNELLYDDFPEAVFPIEQLEGISHRCNGQLYKEQRTHIGWTANEVVLPTIPDSKASGAIIRVAGIMGGIRGMKFARPDGKKVRPSLVVVDDPQTDGSARSPSQCETRERILAGAILGLAGPGRKISGIMPCTVIAQNDMADAILNRDKHPEWQGTRTKMVYEFPKAEALWEENKKLRQEGMRAGRGTSEATEHYRQNRAAMDEGAKVAWEERFEHDEISAVQNAMNLLVDRGARAFHAEFQNQPLPEEESRGDDLTADQVASKFNRMKRGIVPVSCNRITAFIDVHAAVHYYLVAAWEDDFTGYVLDYGVYPDQKRSYFTLRDAKHTLATATKAAGTEGQIYAGLESLTNAILPREWVRDDGAVMKIERCLIDANWGPQTDTVYQFIRQCAHASIITPSHGKFFGAAATPIRDYRRQPGDRVGHNWRVSNAQGKRAARKVTFDTNYWKTFVHTRLAVAMGNRGCLSLFGDKAEEHRLFADHITAEYRSATKLVKTERIVDEWHPRPERPDNHWFDCYDEETETLTRDGWKLFSELELSDELATVNLETDFIEYQRPTALVAKRYEGEMVRIGGGKFSRLDMLVTPSHRMVVFEGQSSKGPLIKQAQDLTIWDKIKTTATWDGDDRPEHDIPATNRHPETKVAAKDLAGFLGWYVAEGSCRINMVEGKGRTHIVVISQNAGPKRDEICALMDRLPWKYHQTRVGVVISNEQAYRLVCDLGNKYTKRVPQWIKSASPEIIGEFVRCAVNGDGWRHRTGEAYATVSRLLADDMMELYLKTGFAVSSRVRKAVAYCIRGRSGDAERCSKQYHVHRKTTDRCQLRDSKNRPNFRRVAYDGMVYCATVPNGTLIVRRNGKIAVCGNCLVGACVAASMQGVTLTEADASVGIVKRKKVSIADLQQRRSDQRPPNA